VTMISAGVEISIAGGVEEIVPAYLSGPKAYLILASSRP